MTCHAHKSLKIALILLISINCCCSADDQIDPTNWTCAFSVTGYEFDVQRISGSWYEVARIPDAEVPACVNVTAPIAPADDQYTLHLQFVNNVNKGWKHTTEELPFPWNNDTQHGIFTLTYSAGESTLNVTFKLVITDYDSFALVCGYSPFAPEVSLVKVMSREAQTSAAIKNQVQQMADKYGMGQHFTWVEHSNRCNGATAGRLSVLLLLGSLIFGVRKIKL